MVDIDKNNQKIEKYSKLFPEELKFIANNLPRQKIDKDWALLMYLFLHNQKGNFITKGKLSKFFNMREDEVVFRLNRMNWLVEQYVTSYGYGKIVWCYEINYFGEQILKSLFKLMADSLDKRLKNQ